MSEVEQLIRLRRSRQTGRSENITQALLTHLRARAKSEQQSRNRPQVEKGILSDAKFGDTARKIQQQGFQDVLKTTLGTAYSEQGILRNITQDDLIAFDRKINALQGKYKGGIKPIQVVNSSQAIDRKRATDEIPWAHPIASRYDPTPNRERLIVTFATAASGKHGTNKHFVNVAFTQFKEITTHRLMVEPSQKQAVADANLLKDSLIEFDCDCGRHTYWYRYIASIGKFAYIGSSPKGRAETGFPKIRNPKLRGIACKHTLRTMHEIMHGAGFQKFIIKAIVKQYGAIGTTKSLQTTTTKQEMERSIKRQKKAGQGVLSAREQKMSAKLLARFRESLERGRQTRHLKDTKTRAQKLAILAKIHLVEHLT